MRRVVVSGLGVVSCLGNSKSEVLSSIRSGRSGIVFNESFKERFSEDVQNVSEAILVNPFSSDASIA